MLKIKKVFLTGISFSANAAKCYKTWSFSSEISVFLLEFQSFKIKGSIIWNQGFLFLYSVKKSKNTFCLRIVIFGFLEPGDIWKFLEDFKNMISKFDHFFLKSFLEFLDV